MSSSLRAKFLLVLLIGEVVYLCAAPQVQLFVSAGNGCGWPHARHGIISSCQSAATSEIVKSDFCKQHYNKYLDLYLYLYLHESRCM